MVNPQTKFPQVPTPPADIDAYLAGKESAFDDIRPGLERQVIWATPQNPARTSLALVYVHGFLASRGELEPLISTLARELEANIYFARLQGHARTPQALANVRNEAWFDDVREAYALGKQIGERVVMIGTSTGGALALWLAAQSEAQDLSGRIVVSPNFHPHPWATRILTWPWGQRIARVLLGESTRVARDNDLQRRYWYDSYPTDGLFPMMAVVQELGEVDLATITTPTLMLYSPRDKVVDSDLALQRFQTLGSGLKRAEAFETRHVNNHVLAGDAFAPENNARALEVMRAFVRQYVAVDKP